MWSSCAWLSATTSTISGAAPTSTSEAAATPGSGHQSIADGDRLVWHAREPITRVPSERSGVEGGRLVGGTMTATLRATARTIVLCALAMLMTGCIKVDLKMGLHGDNTVSGTMVFAVSRD